LILDPLSLKYLACEGANVKIGFHPTTGISYYWYDDQGILLSGGTVADTVKTVIKNSTSIESYWVEPRTVGMIFPRLRIDLEAGIDCGLTNPQGCAATGTVLYKEDFGGNNESDDAVKQEGIDQVKNYTYSLTLGPQENCYTIAKTSTPFYHTQWYKKIDDHTYPNDTARGYMAGFDGSEAAGQFYECQIDDLCAEYDLYFSVWIANILISSTSPDKPGQVFAVEDLNGNVLAQYYTDVPNNGDPAWKHYGFNFTLPNNISSIRLRIINNGTGSNGNYFVMDDIEIRLCVPRVNLTQPAKMDTTLCVGMPINFSGEYTDNGTYGNNLVYRWERNTGDINKPDDWTPVTAEETSTNGIVNTTCPITAVTVSEAGYYRLAIANSIDAANIDNYYCRPMSDIIRLRVVMGVVSGDVSADQTICYSSPPEPLTVTEATGGSVAITYQWQQSTNSGISWENVTGADATTSSHTPPALTQTTQYRLVAKSGTVPCETDTSDVITVKVKAVCAEADHVIASCEQTPPVEVLSNDIFNPSCTPVTVKIITPPVRGGASVSQDNKIEYKGTHSGLDSLTYRVICGMDSSEAKVYITIKHSDSAFVDDVWYYGKDAQGIRFVNNGGVYSAQDASGESKVNSHENSLVVSSPYCNGQTIFYSSHNQLYNSLHEPMTNGSFMGHESVADGLAACYMGKNKYLFFSVTNSYEDGDRGLKAYIIDMNADHGRGEVVDSIEIEAVTSDMSESIELLAAHEPHKYWLIYAYRVGTHHKLYVRPVDVNSVNTNGIVGNKTDSITSSTVSSPYHTYTLKSSPQHNRLAIAHPDNENVDVFDFDNTLGKLTNLHTTPSSHKIDGLTYGVEFSPDGNQLYAAGYTRGTSNTITPKLYQYEITSSGLTYVDATQYWTYTGVYHVRGGGLKLGPDGNIYVVLAYDANVGVISNPNLTTTLHNNRYSFMKLDYEPNSFALQFSTGLTKPSLMECNTNLSPVAALDTTLLCFSATSRTATVNVLQNDIDYDGDKIYLTSANFVHEATDTAFATLTVNPADSSISLTLKPAFSIANGYVFDIIYHIKDDGLPASQCETGMLAVEVYPMPELNSTLTPPSICSGSTFDYTAKTTVAGTNFSWHRVEVTGIAEAEANNTGASIREVLTNTTADSVEVSYYITQTTTCCIHTDTVKVWVYAPLKEKKIELCPGLTKQLIPSTGVTWSIDKPNIAEIKNNRLIEGKSAGTAILTYTLSSTGCSAADTAIVYAYPEPDEITGEKVVCIGKTVQLSNTTAGGVWTHNNANISLSNPDANSVTVTGVTEGKSFVTYSVFNGICQTKKTFRLKVIPNTPPMIIIGFEK
jgi:hypothetical protein